MKGCSSQDQNIKKRSLSSVINTQIIKDSKSDMQLQNTSLIKRDVENKWTERNLIN